MLKMNSSLPLIYLIALFIGSVRDFLSFFLVVHLWSFVDTFHVLWALFDVDLPLFGNCSEFTKIARQFFAMPKKNVRFSICKYRFNENILKIVLLCWSVIVFVHFIKRFWKLYWNIHFDKQYRFLTLILQIIVKWKWKKIARFKKYWFQREST